MIEVARWVAAMVLAGIIAVEATGCPVAAQVAIAQVYDNRAQAGIVGGWADPVQPAADQVAIALTWQQWPDLVDGAIYAIGPGDKAKLAWLAGQHPVARWQCAGGDFIEVYR